MAELGPELVPEGVTLAEALPWMVALTAFVFARGLIGMVDAFVRALFGTAESAIGWVPWVGKVVKRPIHKIEQKLTNILGTAINKLDAYIAHSWHQLSKLVRMLGRELEGLALDIYHVTSAIGGLLSPQQMTRYVKALLHPIRTVQEIERKLRRAEQVALAHIRSVVLHGVYPRLKVAEGEIAHVIEWDIANLRARANRLERRALREFRWIRSRPWLIASAAMTATVAICLRRLGLGWLRCRNWRKVGPGLCGLPVSLFETLALGALGYLAVVDPVDIAKVAIKTEETMHAFVKRVAETNG